MKALVVIVQDAGGAEIIAAYLKAKHKRSAYAAFAAGPAAKIFRREGIPFKPAPKTRSGIARILASHPGAAVLTATGWMTSMEADAIAEGKKQGRTTIAYLESWNRYRERFGYPKPGWRNNLPDEIWVGDPDAKTLAKKFFPRTTVRYVANQYFKNIAVRTHAAARGRVPDAILFMSDTEPQATMLLGDLLHALAVCGERMPFRIRFHPADDRSRYDRLITQYRHALAIEKSSEADIARDLSRAAIVVGTETVALAVALYAGKRAIRLRVPGQKPFLPHKKLLDARSGKEAARLITRA